MNLLPINLRIWAALLCGFVSIIIWFQHGVWKVDSIMFRFLSNIKLV